MNDKFMETSALSLDHGANCETDLYFLVICGLSSLLCAYLSVQKNDRSLALLHSIGRV